VFVDRMPAAGEPGTAEDVHVSEVSARGARYPWSKSGRSTILTTSRNFATGAGRRLTARDESGSVMENWFDCLRAAGDVIYLAAAVVTYLAARRSK
jgi:hypothetical protein